MFRILQGNPKKELLRGPWIGLGVEPGLAGLGSRVLGFYWGKTREPKPWMPILCFRAPHNYTLVYVIIIPKPYVPVSVTIALMLCFRVISP